jgi:hypothetical protein
LNSNLISPPGVDTPVPGEAVDRLLYASRSCVQGPVFKEMHRIRDHALQRNVADGVYVALLYQAGWFMEWMEGPSAGIQAVLRRLERDPRHRELRVVHHSRGPRRLPEPWSMAFRKDHEDPRDFERRVKALAESPDRQELEPASVWRRLSMPLKGSGAAGRQEGDRYQRVMVCSARGTESFELVRWLGHAHHCKVTSQRLAGAQANDVANDYVDLDGGPGAMLRRVVAMARNGLQIGLFQVFLPDYSHLVLLLCGDRKHDMDLIHILVSACSRLAHRPVLLGLGRPGCDHAALRAVARNGGLAYLDCDLGGTADARALWAAAEPALDFSRTANSQW